MVLSRKNRDALVRAARFHCKVRSIDRLSAEQALNHPWLRNAVTCGAAGRSGEPAAKPDSLLAVEMLQAIALVGEHLELEAPS